jgi:hypothetical protein
VDALTGKDYSYRKDWVRDRFRELAGSMAIEVLDYAILDNHLHVVLRNRPETFPPPADDWLTPIFLDERAEACVGPGASSPDTSGVTESTFFNPVRSARIPNKGSLPTALEQYLSLPDSVGRVVRAAKRGRIPADLPPILGRLGLEPQTWLDSFLSLFRGEPHPPPSSLALVTG